MEVCLRYFFPQIANAEPNNSGNAGHVVIERGGIQKGIRFAASSLAIKRDVSYADREKPA